MGLILDSSLLLADERVDFDLPAWLHGRPPEPVAVSVITFTELWFGIEAEADAARSRRRRRWADKLFRRLEVVRVDLRVARIHARTWAELAASGQMIGPYDLIVAATALQRRWAVATFNAREFRHVRGLKVVEPYPPPRRRAGAAGPAFTLPLPRPVW